MSIDSEEMKDVLHELLLEGRIFIKKLNDNGEPVYVSTGHATEEDMAFSDAYLAKLHKGLVDL